MLSRAGRSVLVLERRERVGGAAVSDTVFAGVGARLSRYAYLVSLFPRSLLRTLRGQGTVWSPVPTLEPSENLWKQLDELATGILASLESA